MLANSSHRAEWKCPICSYEWQAEVAQRVRYDSGCPGCIHKALGRKRTQPTFEAAQHQLLREWDYENKPKDGLYPHSTTLNSKKLVRWVCHKCSQEKLHLYQMTPNDPTNRQEAGCPYCAGRRVSECWDFARNDMTPAQVTSRSPQVVWWVNAVRGSWAQRISEHTDPHFNPK